MSNRLMMVLLASLFAFNACEEGGIMGDDDDVADDDDATDDDDVTDDDDTTDDDDSGDDDDTAPVDADGDGWDETVDCDDNDAALNLDDADNDGFSTCDGDCDDSDESLTPEDADNDSYSSCDGDCDDTNGAINADATDLVGNGVDDNCDGIDGYDGDGDGYAADWSGGDDCDDSDVSIHPGAADPCDGIDQDCAGDLADEADADADGSRLCDGDCDDNNGAVYPGATEVCDGVDNDCDGLLLADETDNDGDGMMVCDGDCDDSNPTIYPGAQEVCNGVDDDCDGAMMADEADLDGDGFRICEGDCDDADYDVNPAADEDCMDGIDNDCDGVIDGASQSDYFVQSASYSTDILFVVDNSCSMYEEQANLGTYFQAMYDVLNSGGIDYRIAVATTDNADFQGATPVIDPSTPNGVLTFQNNCDVGTTGSGYEQGLEFGWQALQLAEAGTSPNQDFYREDAGLRVIFVSDEADQSPDTWQDYAQYYQSLKLNPSHVILNGIVGTDGTSAVDCTGAGGTGYAGYNYVEAVNDTGGILSSICDFDWTVIMEDLGYLAEHLADTFELSQVPDPITIEVYVNGVITPSGWAYDAGLNSVVFDPAYVPSVGQNVEITYCM